MAGSGDAFGHVNNTVYYAYIDTAILNYTLSRGITLSGPRPYIVRSSCDFYAPITFPATLEAGVACWRVGQTSVTWRVGLWREEQLCAQGDMVSVFVDPETERPVPLPLVVREAAEAASKVQQLQQELPEAVSKVARIKEQLQSELGEAVAKARAVAEELARELLQERQRREAMQERPAQDANMAKQLEELQEKLVNDLMASEARLRKEESSIRQFTSDQAAQLWVSVEDLQAAVQKLTGSSPSQPKVGRELSVEEVKQFETVRVTPPAA
ncbi:unnamed protein product [Effrenium voratum]|uniref:Thioesterase domain-containing protein n=1 Tax=Effrenium voratum TaxID=2562239 RepID=A0AA36IXP1_9DINO|nr:unnamed protein product [Effrenium voratum]